MKHLVADIGKIAVKGSTSVTSVPSMDSSTPSVKKEDVKLTGSDIIAIKSTSSILNNRSFIGLSDILLWIHRCPCCFISALFRDLFSVSKLE